MKFASVLLVCVAGSAMASSSTLLLSGDSKNISFDILNENNVTALQFDVMLDGVSKASSLKMGSCVSGLPSSHTGSCSIHDGFVRVVVYSSSNAVLPSGSIGTLNIAGVNAKNVQVNNLIMASPDVKQVTAETIIDAPELLQNEIERR